MTTLQITQIRSTIGCKRNQRETLRSLGLKRISHVVEKDDNPVVRGMIHTVRHLVTVEERRDDERGTSEKSSATTGTEVKS